MNGQPLYVDPDRMDVKETGIYVRALSPDKEWKSVDISTLDKDSLLRWLRSRGGKNQWAENTLGVVLGYGFLTDDNCGPTYILKSEE